MDCLEDVIGSNLRKRYIVCSTLYKKVVTTLKKCILSFLQIKNQMKRISTADHLVAKLVRDPKTDLHKLLTMAKRHFEEIGQLVQEPHHALTMAENRLYYVLLAIFASKTNIHYTV